MIGKKFNRLTILRKVKSLYKCRCECGNTVIVPISPLMSGRTKSCGCLRREQTGLMSRTHGMTNTREYSIWRNIKARCYSSKIKEYKWYGALGIKMCVRWKDSFENFIQDMGKCPPKFSIERKDVRKGYTPANCRWASQKEQVRNTTRNISYKGECSVDASRRLGGEDHLVSQRIRTLGWKIERAFTTPILRKK